MEYKNIKSLSPEDLENYKKEITSEYEKIKTKIEKLCEKVSELNNEYIDVEDEIENRKRYLSNESDS